MIIVFSKVEEALRQVGIGLIERFDGTYKIFDVFEVSKQQYKVVLAVSIYNIIFPRASQELVRFTTVEFVV
jgi:hypothetical protein